MRKFLQKIVGDADQKLLKKLQSSVDEINQLEPELEPLGDDELRAKTDELKKELEGGKSLDDILPQAFAVVREASKRTLEQRHFDVQLMGGMVMHQHKIAEMRTGEGKTLVATLPVYLNALSGKGVHVVTVNDYLAMRDAGWMGQIYRFLGLSVGVIASNQQSYLLDEDYLNDEHDDVRMQHLRPVEKKEAYGADVTYGTNNEFGFDYLRDNMSSRMEDYVQRPLNYAIVDEIDSILIDEARTPLIISAPAMASGSAYGRFSSIARGLKAEVHYALDEKQRSATLTDDGVAAIEKMLGVDNLYDPQHVELIYHIEQALRAQTLFTRDKDYVVRDNDVIIVDEFTGRLLPGRRYSEGLHQAIEAKEGVEVKQESMTLATISFQNYFRLYEKLAGMTGTAKTEEEEFQDIYGLDVVVVPTNKEVARNDLTDRIYRTQTGKFRAIVREVGERQAKGQPVLIGTVSIEKNEALSQMLSKAGIKHEVLNGKANEREATIVAEAGNPGAVTLATNVAGRGTDIKLGEGVTDLGGLFVLGSERHDSRRIDNQLRGRSGRQGDPGETQFYVSLDDDLMRIFGGDRIAGIMQTLRIEEDVPIENNMVSKSLERAQKRVESHNFDRRKNTLQYDDVMNRHRKAIYERRRRILSATDELKGDITTILEGEIDRTVQAHMDAETEELDTKSAVEALAAFLPLPPAERSKLMEHKDPEYLQEAAVKLMRTQYDGREKEFGGEVMRDIERIAYLQSVDRLWMEHLENMDHLREGIGLQSIGQRDPLVEYKKQAFGLFESLKANIDREVSMRIFRLIPRREAQDTQEVQTELTEAAAKAVASGPDESGNATGIDRQSRKSSAKQKTTTDNRSAKRRAQRKSKKQRRKKK